MKMRFREDGTFKIMQITDMQEIPAISKDTDVYKRQGMYTVQYCENAARDRRV